MGPQQTAGADTSEIGHQHLAIGFVFNAAQQLPVRGVVLLHHRRAPQTVVVHRHIHPQGIEQVLQSLQPQTVVLVMAGLEEFHMLQQLPLQALQPGLQPRLLGRIGVQALTEFLPFALQQRTHHLAAQGGQPLVTHMFERMRLFQKAGDFLAQTGFIPIDLGALLWTQAHGLARRHGLALLVLSGEHQMPLIAHQAEAAGLGKGVERIVSARLLALESLLDALTLGLHIGFGQTTGNVGLQAPRQLQQALAQLEALTRGKVQRERPFRLRHLVQEQQIGGRRTGGGHIVHELAHERGATRAHLAHHQQVVVRHRHVQAKAGGGFGPLLPHPGQGRLHQLTGAGKTQIGRVHPPQKILGF